MDLTDYIKKEKKKGISPKEIRYIFNQLNNALEIFRNKKNIHTCLCSDNIFIKFKDKGLVQDDYTVKMADFGNVVRYEIKSTSDKLESSKLYINISFWNISWL